MFSRHVKIISRVTGFTVGINYRVTERGRGEGACSSIFLCDGENNDAGKTSLMKWCFWKYCLFLLVMWFYFFFYFLKTILIRSISRQKSYREEMNGLNLSACHTELRDSGNNKFTMIIISAFKWFSSFLFSEKWK